MRGALKAPYDHRPNGLDYLATVPLDWFLRFLAAAGAEFDWLQALGPRWQSRSTATIVPIQGHPGKKTKPRLTYEDEKIEEITRRYRKERSELTPYPTVLDDEKWFEEEYPDLPRSIWRDRIRAQIAPDAGRKKGPRAKRG